MKLVIRRYDIKKLEDAVYDFNRVTGISITLYDIEGNRITLRGSGNSRYCSMIGGTKEGARACLRSNRELISKCRELKSIVCHICGAGLLDIAIPLLNRNEIVGILMIGQIRKNKELDKGISAFPISRERMEECYKSLPLYDEDMIESVINIATMLTKYIMLENMVKSQPRQSATAIADYVEAHLTDRLTVDSVSRGTHISPSGIYKAVKSSFGCTLGEYIRTLRIERSLEFLADDSLSIEKVAESVGFSDPAYYSRSFKRIYGISPLKYRKRL